MISLFIICFVAIQLLLALDNVHANSEAPDAAAKKETKCTLEQLAAAAKKKNLLGDVEIEEEFNCDIEKFAEAAKEQKLEGEAYLEAQKNNNIDTQQKLEIEFGNAILDRLNQMSLQNMLTEKCERLQKKRKSTCMQIVPDFEQMKCITKIDILCNQS